MCPQYHWAMRHYGAHIILRYIGIPELDISPTFSCSSTVDGGLPAPARHPMMAGEIKSRASYWAKRLECPVDENANYRNTFWCNRDLIPIPEDRRTWTWQGFAGYWVICGCVNQSELIPRTSILQRYTIRDSH